MMRWGMPPPPRTRWLSRHQYPQHDFASLARLVEAGKSLLGPGKQLRGIRAGAKPGNEKEGRRLVRAERRPTAVRFRWDLDRIQGRPRHQVKADPRPSPGLRIPDDGTERDSRADPSQSQAGEPDNARGMRRLDARAVGRSEIVAATVT